MDNQYLYQVSAIERPTVAALEQGATARVILPPTTVIANGKDAAIAAAAFGLPKETKWNPQLTTWIAQKFVGDSLR